MLRRQKHALSQSTTPLACTLVKEVNVGELSLGVTHGAFFVKRDGVN